MLGGVPVGVIFLGLWLVAMLVCFAAFTDYTNDLFDATASSLHVGSLLQIRYEIRHMFYTNREP